MITELITQALRETNIQPLREFPKELLEPNEIELIRWVDDYKTSYGAVPSIREVADEFDFFIPFIHTPSRMSPTPPPLKRIAETTIQERQASVMLRITSEIESGLRTDGKLSMDLLNEMRKINAISSGVHRFVTFDRDTYFRRSPIKFPFGVINSAIGGLNLGDLMVLGGRLGTGKSTVAQWISAVALRDNMNVLFVSTEMMAADVYSRVDAMLTEFNPLDLRGEPDDDIMDKLEEAKVIASKSTGEIFVPKRSVVTPSDIAGLIETLEIDLVIVDGAYLLQPSGGKFTSKWERVAAVSNELKQIAINSPTRIIATTQIKRGANGADGYSAEDLSYSDAIGQDADFVVMIYPSPVVVGQSELQLIKNRFGPEVTTKIQVEFDSMQIRETSLPLTGSKKAPISISSWKAGS